MLRDLAEAPQDRKVGCAPVNRHAIAHLPRRSRTDRYGLDPAYRQDPGLRKLFERPLLHESRVAGEREHQQRATTSADGSRRRHSAPVRRNSRGGRPRLPVPPSPHRCLPPFAIISVRIIPGRISKTFTPQPAIRVAYSAADMASPAFEMQYSPRLIDAV